MSLKSGITLQHPIARSIPRNIGLKAMAESEPPFFFFSSSDSEVHAAEAASDCVSRSLACASVRKLSERPITRPQKSQPLTLPVSFCLQGCLEPLTPAPMPAPHPDQQGGSPSAWPQPRVVEKHGRRAFACGLCVMSPGRRGPGPSAAWLRQAGRILTRLWGPGVRNQGSCEQGWSF